ncbi:MAG: hypothetical protein ACRC1H_06950, partial [Caldilineaceae bacterium]
LGQLSAGASQLSDGLVNTAAPGSAALADGANQVADGLDQLNSNVPALEEGVSDLNDGAEQLNDGAQTLADGNKALAEAIALLSEGVQDLPADVKAQVGANPTYNAALDTLGRIIAGIGTPKDQTKDTLLGGLNLIGWGLRSPGTTDCAVALTGGTPKNCGVADANAFISDQLASGVADLTKLADGIDTAASIFCAGSAAGQANCVATFQALASCIDGDTQCTIPPIPPATTPTTSTTIKAKSLAASGALANVVKGIDGLLIPGLNGVKGALYNPADGSQCNPTAQTGDAKACGIAQALTIIKAGIPALVDQITTSIRSSLLGNSTTPGIGATPPASNCNPKLSLVCASAALAQGSAALAGGTTTLAEGTETLNDKVPTLASGVAQLDDGAS